jgi:hypothetical protein
LTDSHPAGGRSPRVEAVLVTRWWRTAVVAGFSVVATAGCVAEAAPPRPLVTVTPAPSHAASPAPGFTGAELAVIEEVLAAYRAFRRLEDELSLRPRPRAEIGHLLAEHLASTFHTQVQAALAAMYEDGLVRRAWPTSQVEVVQLRLDESPQVVVLRECLDITDAPLVYAGSGQGTDDLRGELWMAAATPGRHVRVIEANLYPEEGWLLRHGSWRPEESC